MKRLRGAVPAGASALRGRALAEPFAGGTSTGGISNSSEVATGVAVSCGVSRTASSDAGGLSDSVA